jgi:hypothetical protein
VSSAQHLLLMWTREGLLLYTMMLGVVHKCGVVCDGRGALLP